MQHLDFNYLLEMYWMVDIKWSYHYEFFFSKLNDYFFFPRRRSTQWFDIEISKQICHAKKKKDTLLSIATLIICQYQGGAYLISCPKIKYIEIKEHLGGFSICGIFKYFWIMDMQSTCKCKFPHSTIS